MPVLGQPALGHIHDAARQLLLAYETRRTIQPLSEQFADLTIEDAYAIQQLQVASWTDEGQVVRGHKVGLTSAAMQRQLGVDQPDFGHLTDTMVHEPESPIEVNRFIQPRVEPEFAFILSEDLRGPGLTIRDAAAAVETVLPALEIIDSRVVDWRITLVDTIADNASSGGYVLGTDPLPTALSDLASVPCELLHNGQPVHSGVGADVLGSPLNALAWLANRLGELGVPLRAGHVILSGSLTAAIPVSAGDTVTATFGPLGSVTARFA